MPSRSSAEAVSIGRRLKMLRMKKFPSRGSLSAMSREVGIAVSTLSSYEAGRQRPSFDRLALFAEYFGVSIFYIRGGNEGSKYSCPKCLLRLGDDAQLERLRAHVYQCWKQELLTTSKLAELLGMDIPSARRWCRERDGESNGLQEGGNFVV